MSYSRFLNNELDFSKFSNANHDDDLARRLWSIIQKYNIALNEPSVLKTIDHIPFYKPPNLYVNGDWLFDDLFYIVWHDKNLNKILCFENVSLCGSASTHIKMLAADPDWYCQKTDPDDVDIVVKMKWFINND